MLNGDKKAQARGISCFARKVIEAKRGEEIREKWWSGGTKLTYSVHY